MTHVLRAAVGGVVLAVALAPSAAHAATPKKAAKLSVSRIGKPPSSAETGSSFKVTARVANAKNRKSAAGRLTLSLRPSSGAKTNLKGYNVKTVKGGKTRSLSLTISVPSTLKAGTYSLVVCVRRTGTSGATCKTAGRIVIRLKPAPTPAPARSPLRPPRRPRSHLTWSRTWSLPPGCRPPARVPGGRGLQRRQPRVRPAGLRRDRRLRDRDAARRGLHAAGADLRLPVLPPARGHAVLADGADPEDLRRGHGLHNDVLLGLG